MKKIVASLGLVALGATGLQGANAPGLSRIETSKPWSISAALRGFYDDNYLTAPSGLESKGVGVEITPTISYNLPLDRTYFGVSYTYGMQYFNGDDDDVLDHQHELLGTFDHKFNERYRLNITDTLVYTQEPEVLNDASSPIRTDSNALRNRLRMRFRAELTEAFGVEPLYRNTFTMYDDDGVIGGRSSLLDRVEHLIGVNGRYRLRPDVVGLVGYNFGLTDYIGDDEIGLAPGITGDVRNNHSHYFYVGAEHNVTRKLKADLQVGAQYTRYTESDQLGGPEESTWGPYVDGNLEYTYLPGSSVSMGFKHERNPTDLAVDVNSPGELTLDQESTLVYASVDHRFMPRLTGSLLGQYQHSTFNGGGIDGEKENLFLVGLAARYRINSNWSAEAGYNWSKLDSDQPRSFARNRLYIGVRARY